MRRLREMIDMRAVHATLLIPALASVLLALPCAAQSVRGRVLDAGTGQPLAGARVSLFTVRDERIVDGTADSLGVFVLPAPPGEYRLRGSLPGYRRHTSGDFRVLGTEDFLQDLRLRETPMPRPLLAGLVQQPAGLYAPGAGAGLEVSWFWPVRRGLEAGVFGWGSVHIMSPETAEDVTRPLSRDLFLLPPRKRGLDLIAAGIDARQIVYRGGTVTGEVGGRLQGGRRRFRLERPGSGGQPLAVTSWGPGGGVSGGVAIRGQDGGALTLTLAQEWLSFGGYNEFEQHEDHRTAAVWGITSLRFSYAPASR